jgi:mono/diheme cytochrome c family protein
MTGAGVMRVTLRRIGVTLVASSLLITLAACSSKTNSGADPRNADQVASGKVLYERNCASCHGAALEGQPDWKSRDANGRMPAPPHDDSGHTWHHADDILFGITKIGVAPPYGPPDYQSDMPAFGGTLTDQQIWDVLTYIKSRWSARALEAQTKISKQSREK